MRRAVRTSPEQLQRARVRSWIERKVLEAGAPMVHDLHGDRKQAVIGSMHGTVVEIGPGAGPNFRYYAPGVRVIAIEPNVHWHDALRRRAEEFEIDLEIRTLRGEGIDVDDETADGVVGTLVLCGVDDPAAVVNEIRRVLVPGGTYFHLEHVAAPAGTTLRRIQNGLFRPHRWMFNGCETNRDTAAVIASAGFSEIDHHTVDAGVGSLYIRHHLIGTAVK